MKITDLYSIYKLPPNLQRHLFLVSAVGKYIVDHWQGPKINREQVVKTLLVHDLGNLVKYDFSSQAQLLDSSLDPLYWSEVQEELIRRYGSKDIKATTSMLEELGIDRKTRQYVTRMNASRLQDVYQEELELQICEYADMRIAPQGVTSLEKRLKDVKNRYQVKGSTWANDELFNKNLEFGKKIEKRLAKHTQQDLSRLSEQDLEESLVKLSQYQLKIPLWTSLLFRIKHFAKPLGR